MTVGPGSWPMISKGGKLKSLDGDLLTHLTLYHLSSCRCAYYETCATYGLNVERVFQDGKETFCVSQVHDSLF